MCPKKLDAGETFEELLELARAGNPVGLLEAILDDAQPEVKACLEPLGAEGEGAALARLRAHHTSLPRQPILSFALWGRKVATSVSVAEETMNEGCRIGGREPFPLQTPIDWGADPFQDRSWRFQLNTWTFLQPIVEAHAETEREELASFARGVALDWIEQNIQQSKDNEFAWAAMAVGQRAAILAAVLDRSLRDAQVRDEELVWLLSAARVHASYLSDGEKIAWDSTHGIYQLAGLLALTRAIPELKGAERHREFAASGLVDLLRSRFTDDGIHTEHSPRYHVLLVNLLGSILRTGWIE
ncbi:MAG: heparinase II/III family protein, partial [Planctomycetota bacterium]